MRIEDISKESLILVPDVRHADFENELYFLAEDINRVFMGAFQHLPTVSLPVELKGAKGLFKSAPYIKYSDIKAHADSLSGLSDFNINIRTALNFNPKKK